MNIVDGGNYAFSAFVDLTKAFGKLTTKYHLIKWIGVEFKVMQMIFSSHILILENSMQYLMVLGPM